MDWVPSYILSILIPLYSFISYMCVCVCTQLLSPVQLFVTPCTVAHQPLLSMKFSRQEYWSELPFLIPGDFPDPRIEPMSPVFPALAGRFFTAEPCEKPIPSICIPEHKVHLFFLLNILNIGYTCRFLFTQCLYSITLISLCDAQIVPKLDGGNPFILVPMSLSHNPINL